MFIALLFVLVPSILCLTSLTEYEILHYAPPGTRLLISGEDPTKPFKFKSSIKCSLNTSATNYLPIRLITANIGDKRLGPYYYNRINCFNVLDLSWENSDNCEFNLAIEGNNSIVVTDNDVFVMECDFKSKIYASELYLFNQSISALINYPNIQSDLIHGYLPGESISCVNRNSSLPANTWRNVLGDQQYSNPLIMNISSTPCPNTYLERNIQAFKCFRGAVMIYYVKFVILNCFTFKFISNLGKTRIANDIYDAGEKLSCAMQVDDMNAIYFNPTYSFKVEVQGSNTFIGTSDYWFDIPEKIQHCHKCSLVCFFEFKGTQHYFINQSHPFYLNTNFKTVLETKSSPLIFVYNEPFRCLPSHYGRPVETFAVKEENPQPPYSIVADKWTRNRYGNSSDGWLILKTVYEPDITANKWMVYCQLSNKEISTPIVVTISYPINVKISLIYPYGLEKGFATEGFIYSCEGFKVLIVKFECVTECSVISFKSSVKEIQTYGIIKEANNVVSVSVKCTGYRSLRDSNPIVVFKNISVFPSTMKRYKEIYVGRNFSCKQNLVFARRYMSISFDVRVYFQRFATSWISQTNVLLEEDSIKVPNMTDLTAKYCCLQTIDANGSLECDSNRIRNLSIIYKITTVLHPPIKEHVITYLECGTFISCKMCVIYTIARNVPQCISETNLRLDFSRNDRAPIVIKGVGSIQLPEAATLGTPDSIEKWNITLQCINPLIHEVIERQLKLKSCTSSLAILPLDKTIFRINESLECSTESALCRENPVFQIEILTGSIVTTNISRGMSVRLDSVHAGKNIIKCSYYKDVKLFIKKTFFVETMPTHIDIINYKAIVVVGNTMICEGFGFPKPTKEWWFVTGPGSVQIKENKLTILADSPSGDYVYECEIQNINGRLRKLVKFRVFNSYGWTYSDYSYYSNDKIILFILTLSVLLLFLVLFFILVYLCREEVSYKKASMF